MALNCAQHKQKYLYCGKKHVIDNTDLSVIVCTECKKNWSYHVKPTCKRNYEKSNSNPPVCENYNVVNGERENISI